MYIARFSPFVASTVVLLAATTAGLAACSAETPAPASSEKAAARPPAWTAKTECPEEIAILDRPSCRLISQRQRLVRCPVGTVGHDVRAAGISCRDVAELLSPLGGSAGFGVWNKARQKLTRPAVATYSPPFEIRDTGWTCWADFVPERSYGVQYVCWRHRAVLTFKFS